MGKNELISMWESKIKEIEEKGNFTNRYGDPNFFSSKFTKEEMINYCKTKIEQIKEDETIS